MSKLAWLTQLPEEFDFESSHWPPQLRHTGPFHDGVGRIDVAFPWERLTGEPLIYASMGTQPPAAAGEQRWARRRSGRVRRVGLVMHSQCGISRCGR